MKLPKMRWADVATLIVVVGFGVQGYGLYEWQGSWCANLVVGTEIALVGLVGVWRHAG